MKKYKEYTVTVEILRFDGKLDHTRMFPVKAKDAEEADAIVHNRLVFENEPRFRIKEVKEG